MRNIFKSVIFTACVTFSGFSNAQLTEKQQHLEKTLDLIQLICERQKEGIPLEMALDTARNVKRNSPAEDEAYGKLVVVITDVYAFMDEYSSVSCVKYRAMIKQSMVNQGLY